MLLKNFFDNINTKYKKHHFSGISFDSRHVRKNYIFFAINGTKFNGKKFIHLAIKNGARTIVSDTKIHKKIKGVCYIKDKNPRKLLAKISAKIYKKKPKNIIGVTGTNGKTSVVNFYYQILNLNKKKVACIGTLGIKPFFKNIKLENTTLNPILINKILQKAKELNINNVIMEASSHGLKQNRLDYINFNTGIFTNLSHDHLDYHKNFQDYLNSKLYLFRNLLKKNSNIITDSSINEYRKIKKVSKSRKIKILTIGEKDGSLKLINHYYEKNYQAIKIKYKNKIYSLKINLIGKIQIKNILMAMLAAEKSGLKFKKIVNSIRFIKPVYGRFETIGKIKNDSKVILDFAHTPDALENCLKNLTNQFKQKISILFGCGGDRDKSKRAIMGKIANKYCKKIYLTDDNPRFENPKNIRKDIKKFIDKKKVFEISDRKKAIFSSIMKLTSNQVLLVAGKGHESFQDYGKVRKIFSDKEIIIKSINKKNKILTKNFKTNIFNEIIKIKKLKKKINKISINSKEIKKNDIFFAIKGKHKNGNIYVSEAIKKGATLAVVNKLNKFVPKSKQIVVDNSLSKLTRLAQETRKNSNAKIISITGSCGKTSVKNMTGSLIKKFSRVSISPKSFNNQYGVPLSLANLRKEDNFGVYEIGMSNYGEIDKLSKIVNPDVGVITNISYAHAKNFKNLKGIALAKSEIIQNIRKNGFLILNKDDKFFYQHFKIARKNQIKVISFSLNKKTANVFIKKISKIKNKYKLTVSINGKIQYFYIKFIFENYLKNVLNSISIFLALNNVDKLNKKSFFDIKISDGRGDISRIKIKMKKINFIDESYNANPLSVNSALKNFNDIKKKFKEKKILILGDMLELGKHSRYLHKNLSKSINNTDIDKVYIYGKYAKYVFDGLTSSKKGLILRNFNEIVNLIKYKINNNDYLMIKGSNSTGLNKLSSILKKGKINAL